MRPSLVTSPHHAASPRQLAACVLVAALVCLGGRADAAQGEARAGLAPASGPGGTSVRIAGSGFAARKAIRIHAGAKTLGRARTDAAGRFTATVGIPARAGRTTAIASAGGGAKVVNRFV